MRTMGLLRLALVSMLAAACGPDQVVFVEDVDALADALARHRPKEPRGPEDGTVIELAAGIHELEDVMALPPGVTLRGDPDGGSVIDGSSFFPRPWRVAECQGRRPTVFPQPMLEYTQNTIEDLTFENVHLAQRSYK